jgi:CBS domain containing-hemolysin-like protein
MTDRPTPPEGNGSGKSFIASLRSMSQLLRKSGRSSEQAAIVEAGLETSQSDMILKAARFHEMMVADVMKPRADIVAVEASAALSDVARVFAESQLARLPVYRETLDDPIGFVHVKDILRLLAPDEVGVTSAKHTDRVLARIKREVLFVPQSMRLPNLLLLMRSTRIHMALVVDEYGGTDGLATIEDVVEAIFGAIDDEHDIDEAPLVSPSRAGVIEADGRASVEALEKALDLKLALPEQEDDFDTVAGLATALAGRLPQRGELLHHPAGVIVEVIDADPRRVKRVRIKASPPPGQAGEGAAVAEPAPAASDAEAP